MVASPAHLATAESIAHPRDLLRHRCIGYRMLSSGALCAWEFERAGEVLSVQVSGPSATNEPDLMLAAALDGLGICDVLENEAARMSPPGGWCGCWKTGCPLSGLPPLLPPRARQMRPVWSAFIDAARLAREPTASLSVFDSHRIKNAQDS